MIRKTAVWYSMAMACKISPWKWTMSGTPSTKPFAPANGFVEGVPDIVHFQGDILHAIAMLYQTAVFRIIRRQGRHQNEGDVSLAQDTAGLLPHARFQAGIGH